MSQWATRGAVYEVGQPNEPADEHKGLTQGVDRALQFIAGLAAGLENWLPWTWAFSRYQAPRPPSAAYESPFDIDARDAPQRFGDNPSAGRIFPYPWQTGVVSGFMPMLDPYSARFAWAKNPFGPGIATPIPIPWDAQFPGLPKRSG